MFKAFIAIIFIMAPCISSAIELNMKVVRVVDGDTLEVVDASIIPLIIQPLQFVRLVNIDAPEKEQEYGRWATEQLKGLVAGKVVKIDFDSTDLYGRLLGKVKVDDIDVNRQLVRVGAAWVYERYNVDETLLTLQHEAQHSKLGLWRDPQPIPPWEWRKIKNNN